MPFGVYGGVLQKSLGCGLAWALLHPPIMFEGVSAKAGNGNCALIMMDCVLYTVRRDRHAVDYYGVD